MSFSLFKLDFVRFLASSAKKSKLQRNEFRRKGYKYPFRGIHLAVGSFSSQRKLKIVQSRAKVYLKGIAMGAADIVPGISGGTMALILGIYEELIESIRRLNKAASYLFLLPLLLGIASAFLGLSGVIHEMLRNPEKRSLLYALFMGLVLASALILARLMKRWSPLYVVAFLMGGAVAYWLTGSFEHSSATPYRLELFQGFSLDLKALGGGMLAVSAMLLPGVSGSYLLNMVGLYAPAMGALSALRVSLSLGQFDQAAAGFLFSMLLGIGVGAALFSHVVSWLLRHYHDLTMAVLVGFMLGALRSVWPFWEMGQRLDASGLSGELQPIRPIMPELFSGEFLGALAALLAGFLLVLFLERQANQSKA